jgi:hypothetical protein
MGQKRVGDSKANKIRSSKKKDGNEVTKQTIVMSVGLEMYRKC